MQVRKISGVAAVMSLLLAGGVCLGQTAESPAGSKIEVREGDSWTRVTLVRKEGRRTLVRYDDNTEEWVTGDRLRPVGAGVPAGGGSDNARSTPGGAAAKTSFAPGDKVEFKGIFNWEAATVERVQRGWYLLKDDTWHNLHWIEPWAIRVPGATYDIGRGPERRNNAAPGEAPPTTPPGPAPQPKGNQFVAAAVKPDGQLADGIPVIEFDHDHAVDPQPAKPGAVVSFVPTTRPALEFGSCTIRPKYTRLDSVVPCRDTPGTALIIFGLFMNDPAEIIRIDTTTRRVIDRRIMEPTKQRVVGAAQNGEVILTLPNEAWPKQMHLWQLVGGAYTHKAAYKPLSRADRNIVHATLLDATHALVTDNGGETAVLDLEKKKSIGFVRPAQNTIAHIHPSGKLIGVLSSSHTALLLRPDDFSTVAEFDDAAGRGNVTVDPSGAYAAYITSANVVRIVKIADGSTAGTVMLPGKNSSNVLDLLSPETLMLDHKTVYDIKTGMPTWVYNTPNETRYLILSSGQILFAAVEGDAAAACVATLPDSVARAALKSLNKDSFIVRPGTEIHLEADLAAFGEEAAKATETVKNAVTAAGLVISELPQPISLRVTVAAGPTERRDVQEMRWGPPVVDSVLAPCNIVTATLIHQDQPIWSQEIRFQIGGMAKLERGQNMQELALQSAKLTATGIGQLALPSYLPKGSVPGAPPALGASNLTVRGFVAQPKPTPPPAATPPRPGVTPPPRRNQPTGTSA